MPKLRYYMEQGGTVAESAFTTLKETEFNECGPGSVVADADLLLEYIAAKNLAAGGKTQLLPLGKVDEINSMLTGPLAHGLKRPQQRSLPNVNGLYLLLRASGLIAVQGKKLTVNPQVWANWQQLNWIEKYFALLTAWLVDARPEIIGERGRHFATYTTRLVDVTQRLEKQHPHVGRQGVELLYCVEDT
jgi:hypothetical protein